MGIVGIDPSLTATGCVLLSVKSSEVQVLERVTIRTAKRDDESLPLRLSTISAKLAHFLQMNQSRYDHIVIEDPTDFHIHGGAAFRKPQTIAKLGAAFGIVLATVWLYGENVETVPSRDWIPRSMKHAEHRTALRRLYPDLVECTDDETFAAGVALYWYRAQGAEVGE